MSTNISIASTKQQIISLKDAVFLRDLYFHPVYQGNTWRHSTAVNNLMGNMASKWQTNMSEVGRTGKNFYFQNFGTSVEAWRGFANQTKTSETVIACHFLSSLFIVHFGSIWRPYTIGSCTKIEGKCNLYLKTP